MKRITFLTILFALFLIPCLAQEKQNAELIGQLSYRVGNDALLSHFDIFYGDVSKTSSTGYIVITASKSDPIAKYIDERRIKGCFLNRRLSDKNFLIAFTEDKEDFEIKFWRVPNGAQKPQFAEMKPDYNLSGMTRSRLVYDNSWQDDYCPLHFNLEFYSNFLKANPNLIGKIIIEPKNLNDYRKVKKDYFSQLTKTYKIPQRQLKFVKAKNHEEGYASFWLVPVKKK